MAISDAYQLIDVQTWESQTCLNVYFFKQNNVVSISDTATELVDRFLAELMPSIRAVQSSEVLHTEIRCTNLYNPSDNHTRAISLAGTAAAGNELPTFSAYGFTLVQDNGSIRNGAKRIPGIGEGSQDDGVITDAPTLVLLNTLADKLSLTLTDGLVATWLPVIIKRIAIAGGGYRLPTSAAEAVIGAIIDAIVEVVVTSQVSRKVGVGA